MAEFARRTHQASVTLLPGQSKTFRLPPMTPGSLVIDARLAAFVIPDAPRTKPLTKQRAPLLSRLARTQVIKTGPTLPGLPGGPVVVDPGPTPPPPSTPTDLKLELLYGGQVAATAGSHILFTAQTKDDARNLRLTRDSTGTGPHTYLIEVNYPSALPIVERRIAAAAFQNAFDANWNQHPYVAVEATPDYHVLVTFDEQFRLLYGLDNMNIDLGVPAIVPNMDRIKTTDLRFSIGHDWVPLPATIITPYQVPYIELMVTMKIDGHGETWFRARFHLLAGGEHIDYITRVESPILDAIAAQVPGVGIDDLKHPIETALDNLGGARFGHAFTPWLCGEAGRELWDHRFDPARNEIVNKHVGRPPPPSDEPEVIDPTHPPAPADPNPRLFDTPDEVPPPPPPTDAPLPRTRITTSAGPLANINNIVVVMQENRSFDQVLGYLSRELGRTDVNGLSADPDSLQLNRHDGGDGERVYRPQRVPETKWFSFDVPGPCHEHECVVSQISDNMGHFVSNYFKRVGNDRAKLQRIMDYFGPDQLPAYAALARDFAICDAWHCAHVGPTWPNRFITLTGDLNRDREGEVELNQPDIAKLTPLTARTLLDHMTERNVSWRVYEHGYSFVRLYGRYTFDVQNVRSYRDPLTGFAADARAGRLPQVTFIEPDYIDLPPGNDDHPPGDMADGQRFIADIVSALLESPQWDRTLLVITYDEHGGFYDHVLPPEGVALTGDLRRLGPRVPTFVVSPWVNAGAVAHTTFDHTSIAATILRRFCSPHPPRLSARADAAADLRELIQPTPRPRSAFNGLHDQLVNVRNRPAPAPQKPKKLAPWTDPDDFHSLLSYVRSFT